MQSIWKPLKDPQKSTRIFELLPGSPGAKICLRLHHVTLANDAIHYDAVSYTWGDDPATMSIEVDGHEYHIRHNLWEFIHRLRKPDQSYLLWADAISINQNDLDEKSQQVQIIGQIFQKATTVRTWLGEHADASETVMEYLTCHTFSEYLRLFSRWKEYRIITNYFFGRVAHALRMSQRCTSPSDIPWAVIRRINSLTSSCFTREERSQLHTFLRIWVSFFSRPYWHRTWIAQELLLAREVILHPHFCSLD